MFARQQQLLRLLLRRRPGAHGDPGPAFSSNAVAQKQGYSIGKIKLEEEVREGAKAQLIGILRPLGAPATTSAIWEAAQAHPRFKSKRFMKQMLQHMRKVGLARTSRVNALHFGYSLTPRARTLPQQQQQQQQEQPGGA